MKYAHDSSKRPSSQYSDVLSILFQYLTAALSFCASIVGALFSSRRTDS